MALKRVLYTYQTLKFEYGIVPEVIDRNQPIAV